VSALSSLFVLLREISSRHWIRAPLRSGLVVVGIALGVALYAATECAAASMLGAFGELVERVAGRADLTVQAGSVGVSSDRVADIAELPGVEHAAATLEVTTQAPDLGESLLVLGVDLLGDLHFLPFAAEGDERIVEDPLAFVNDPTAILVASRLAKRHGLSKGSKLRLLTSDGPKEFDVRGVLEDSGPAAAFGGQVAVMFIDAAQVSFARGTFVDRVDIALTDRKKAPEVKLSLEKLLGAGVAVDHPDKIGSRLRALTEPLHNALRMSGLVALMVGAFLVYNAVGVAVAQRTRELGLLRALGVTRGGTARLLCFEAAVLALPGIALGLVVARILAEHSTRQVMDTVNRMYFSVAAVEPRLTFELAARATVAGIVTSIVAAWWPARRGAATEPAVILRGASSVERTRMPLWPMLAGAAVLVGVSQLPALNSTVGGAALAIFTIIIGAALATPMLVILLRRLIVPLAEWALGTPGRLGLDYVQRTLGRSTVNVLALMVAVSMTVSVGGWLSSFETSLSGWFDGVNTADLTVTSGSPLVDRSHVPMKGELSERVRTVPGVRAVQPYRIFEQEYGGLSLRMMATTSDVFLAEATRLGKGWPLIDGAPLVRGDLSEKSGVLISDSAARRLHKRVGDQMTFHTPKGEAPFIVRGIVRDYASNTGSAFIDRNAFVERWGDDSIDAVATYIEAGASPDAVSEGIRKALGGTAIFVTTTSQVKEKILGAVKDAFTYSKSVEWITMFIALLGIAGTMLAAVIDRRREVATLRAIGASPRQVALAIVIEAGFLGFCAVVVGVLLGIGECLLFLNMLVVADTGWNLSFVFPWSSTTRIAALAILTSMLAGGFAALRASRTDIVGSVVYE